MVKKIALRMALCMLFSLTFMSISAQSRGRISGTITTKSKTESTEFATVRLKDTSFGTTTNEKGGYTLLAPAGEYTMVVSLIGFETVERKIVIESGQRQRLDVEIKPAVSEIDEVVVEASAVKRLKESAYNVIAIDAKSLHNTTLDLAGALAKVPGVKLRESGGVGSDMRFSLDGFSGRHVKFFIDGVPQEGVGKSFSINNIPVNYAERIEVYRGVVPVGFGADALGGVVNIVTGSKRRTFVDASYSYGSFNTHKSYINAGHVTDWGGLIELNAFQNYSDNSYHVYTSVKDLETGMIDTEKIEKVKRFHDNYHNESVILKLGLVNKSFADRLVFAINYSQSNKEIQNGVEQSIVFGEKRTKGHSIMPSLEYSKRNLLTQGLDVNFSLNYNSNMTHNLDTATRKFNWRGESKYTGVIGEQSKQNTKYDNDNWNGTFTAKYSIGAAHSFVFNHVLTSYERTSRGSSETQTATDTIAKKSNKNISGLSYRFNYKDKWNVSVFGKYYNQYSKGPRKETTSGNTYVGFSETVDNFGFGAAATYFFLRDFQAKASYEKTMRLPTTEELFGDEDMELGSMELKPEKSYNYNLGLSYNVNFARKHTLYIEANALYRDTRDYIRRVISTYSGGLRNASHENHGKVITKGFSAEARYSYGNVFTIVGNITSQNIRNKERYISGSTTQESTSYGVRMPNMPYFFTNADASYNFRNLFGRGNVLTVTYGNLFVKGFPLYWANEGTASSKKRVPKQFSHDASVTYSIKNGMFNFALECKNFTDERLYDNYSLQKPGRAFYGKVRYFFGK